MSIENEELINEYFSEHVHMGKHDYKTEEEGKQKRLYMESS